GQSWRRVLSPTPVPLRLRNDPILHSPDLGTNVEERTAIVPRPPAHPRQSSSSGRPGRRASACPPRHPLIPVGSSGRGGLEFPGRLDETVLPIPFGPRPGVGTLAEQRVQDRQ